MTGLALDFVAAWGGLAIRWVWQATWIAAVALILDHLISSRRSKLVPHLRFGLLIVALIRFAAPPLSIWQRSVELPAIVSGPAENGLELLVRTTAGTAALGWPGWLALTLVGGALVRLAVLGRQAVALRSIRKHSQLVPSPLLAQAVRLAGELRLRRIPEIRESETATVPFVSGLWRPVVVLPRGVVRGLRADDLSRVVAHELAHVRNGDLWLNAAIAALSVVWWFHPLFWRTASAIRQSREEECDSAVVRDLEVRKATYARTLLSAAELCEPGRVGVTALLSGHHPLERRLELLAQGSPVSRRRRVITAAIVVLASLGALSSGGTASETHHRQVIFDHTSSFVAAEQPDAHSAGHDHGH